MLISLKENCAYAIPRTRIDFTQKISLLLWLDSTYAFKREDIDRLLPIDGDSYRIEYKTGSHIRKYAFVQPEEYAHFYKQAGEFKDYLAIRSIFEKELKRKEF